MGKASRLKKERLERIRLGLEEPTDKEKQKIEQKQAVNNSILNTLKAQWKKAVEEQYKTEPDKVRNSNIEKNAREICGNWQVKTIMKTQGIKKEDIERILTEIKNEVIAGG